MAVRQFLRSLFGRGSISKSSTTSISAIIPSISSQPSTYVPPSSSTAPSTAPSTSPNSIPSVTPDKVLVTQASSPLEEAIATLNFVKRLPLEELGLIGSGFSDLGDYTGVVRALHLDHNSGFATEESDVNSIESQPYFLREGVFALPSSQFSYVENSNDDNNGSDTTSLGNYKLKPLPFPRDIESETITLSSTESTAAVEGRSPFTRPRQREYVGRHRLANATQPTFVPASTPTSTSIFLSERLEEIQQLAWLAANIEVEEQAKVLDIQDDMFCTDPRHTLCRCQRWRLGNYLFFARDLTNKETRIIKRAAIMVDISLYASMGSISVKDFLLFKDQLIPKIEGVPALTQEVFQLLASKYFCRGVFNAEQKRMLVELQPCFDDDYVEMEDDPKPMNHIEGLVFMTDDEFAELPEYWEVADSWHYNSRFKRPPMNMFRASDYGCKTRSGMSTDGITLHELSMPSIDEPGVGDEHFDLKNEKCKPKRGWIDEDISNAYEMF